LYLQKIKEEKILKKKGKNNFMHQNRGRDIDKALKLTKNKNLLNK